MNLLIKEDILEKAEITAQELTIEIAVYLYDTGRLTMGQARNLAQLDQISFQKELSEATSRSEARKLSKRDVYLKYDIEDLETDLDNLQKFKEKRSS